MAIANIDPRDNPLAISVSFDTIINNVSLNPGEAYDVTGPTFIGGVGQRAKDKGLDILTNRPGSSFVKNISLLGNNYSWFWSIHYPAPGKENVIYMVPTRFNQAYEGKQQELTEASQSDVPFSDSVPQTWRQAAKRWVADMVDFNGFGAGGATANGNGQANLKKRLGFTVIGKDTNKTDKIGNFEISLNSIVKG